MLYLRKKVGGFGGFKGEGKNLSSVCQAVEYIR